MRVPGAVARLHVGNLKALIDGLASCLEEADIVPAQVIRESAARLGEPAFGHLGVWDIVTAIDNASTRPPAE